MERKTCDNCTYHDMLPDEEPCNSCGIGVPFWTAAEKSKPADQRLKADGGKPRLSLVPMEILTAVARVREFGCNKYGDNDSWRKVSAERYRDALLRHIAAYITNPNGNDSESGLPHLWHAACNIAFLVELEGEK